MSPTREPSTSPASSPLTTPSRDLSAITIVQDLEDGIEFHASYTNDLGTGHVTIVSNSEDGMVELVINQLVAHEVEEGSIVSVSLPPDAAGAIIRALSAGISVALQQRRLTKYN